MSELYLGLMSGTSADGIDAALVDFSQIKPKVVGTHYVAYDNILRHKILSLYQTGEHEIQRLAEADVLLGKAFAAAALDLLKNNHIEPTAVQAIGSHGQTIRHLPKERFTLQIGDPNIIATETGITTVADFRRKDIALGGQGAPLVPAFHQYIFSTPHCHRAIVNIGGIANITLLSKETSQQVIGFDTGPGNTLLDSWISLHQQQIHDTDGAWAAQGKVCEELLQTLLSDPYFQLPAPKSTGREYFNLTWLNTYLNQKTISPIDVQTTLTELTALSIYNDVRAYLPEGEMLICGGGAHNRFLMQRLAALAEPSFNVHSTMKEGVAPDWVEAIAFAWMARQTMKNLPSNLPSVTGAKQAAILGGIFCSSIRSEILAVT